jgi:hypothetical protein
MMALGRGAADFLPHDDTAAAVDRAWVEDFPGLGVVAGVVGPAVAAARFVALLQLVLPHVVKVHAHWDRVVDHCLVDDSRLDYGALLVVRELERAVDLFDLVAHRVVVTLRIVSLPAK